MMYMILKILEDPRISHDQGADVHSVLDGERLASIQGDSNCCSQPEQPSSWGQGWGPLKAVGSFGTLHNAPTWYHFAHR